MTEHVEQCVIRPMRAAFPCPTHVRGNPEATEALLNVYRKALAGYDRGALEQAWQKVAAEQDYWMWPMPQAIVAAAEHFHKRAHPVIPQTDDWVEKAQALADGYWRRYAKTTAAVRAREGGYEPKLKEYVLACGWVQAQYIAGRQGVGYDHAVTFGTGPMDKEAEEGWFDEAREQAQTGEIKVLLPRGLTAKWKTEAQGEAMGR